MLGLALLALSLPVAAVIETYEFSDPALEERYQLLSAELRCPKCQNQNIADSNAPISKDLRKLLHQQLEAGASDEEILDYMVARYGEFVRYRPRFDGATAVLWLAPALLVLAGVAIALLTLRGRRRQQTEDAVELSAAERQRLQQLLDKTEHDS
ncbi:MAG: cytochrome c-type biogenesis protein CcmH [Pseudomonadales bacterium]|nr:cytochrome c-type biogenesis protein CcmH [Pseudomonadales bacterium]MCP5166684.1 cytochrome c-type biogenesis protein CcmH [Pseudomonadales bacterium]MCP5186639.1 cytochrome c-type biogenesis protein CcmH [Pseudomonadales bacterium]